MQFGRHTSLIRRFDGNSEFVVDTSHLPLVITTWFGAPSLELARTYTAWFAEFVEHNRSAGRRFVVLDDAMRAERPAPAVRGCLSKIRCPPEVVVDRIVVTQARSIRGAITALSWITGNPIKTDETIEGGVRGCLALLDSAKVERPRDFEFQPAEPTRAGF